jgi:hypothetical protein
VKKEGIKASTAKTQPFLGLFTANFHRMTLYLPRQTHFVEPPTTSSKGSTSLFLEVNPYPANLQRSIQCLQNRFSNYFL